MIIVGFTSNAKFMVYALATETMQIHLNFAINRQYKQLDHTAICAGVQHNNLYLPC